VTPLRSSRSCSPHFVFTASLLFALALASTSGCDAGGRKSAEMASQARALYEFARLDKGPTEYTDELTARAQVFGGGLDAQAIGRLRAAVSGACAAGEAHTIALDAFTAAYDETAAAQVRAWYEGELGARILAMEVAAGEGDFEAKLRDFIDHRLLDEVPRPERTDLLKRLVATTGAVADQVATDGAATRTLGLAERRLQPEAERQSIEEIEATLANRGEALGGALVFQQGIVFQYIYEHASDDDLARYTEFCESDAGAWLFSANRQSLDAVMNHIERAVLKRLDEGPLSQ